MFCFAYKRFVIIQENAILLFNASLFKYNPKTL